MAGSAAQSQALKDAIAKKRQERLKNSVLGESSQAQLPETDKGGVAGGSYEDLRTVHATEKRPGSGIAKEPPATPTPKPMRKPQSTQGQARTYQKHVLFAIVSAFLIKLVSGGKFVPKS
jgi:hypothetical protein